MRKLHFVLILAATIFLMSGFFILGHLDDAAGRRSLEVLTPAVTAANDAGLYLVQNMHRLLVWSLYGIIGFLAICAVQGRSWSYALGLAGVSLALLTQFILIDETTRGALAAICNLGDTTVFLTKTATVVGIVGYSVSILLLVLGWRSPSAPKLADLRTTRAGYPWLDVSVLLLIILVGSLFRIYALNQHFNYFEGELSPYSAGATSLSGMFYANRGSNGPWAPLGLLYYLPIYITTSLFQVNLLALRESSALVGILTIPLMYLLANAIAGRVAAIFTAALFALNCLHIGWSRTDIHPHGVTTWPTLLMCFFLLKAAETRKLSWAFGTALMMGLSWHQYPSGQSAVAIPLIAIGFYFLFNRATLPVSKLQLAVILLGVGLWFVGLPLSYYPTGGTQRFLNPFTLTGPRALWGTDGLQPSGLETLVFVLTKAAKHLWDFVQGVVFKTPYLFHQEWLPAMQPYLSRSVPWFVASLAVVATTFLGVQRKRFEAAVLCGWFIAAVLPGILSEHAYPKRLSTVFPLLDLLAGVGCSAVLLYIGRFSGRFSKVIVAFVPVVAVAFYMMYSSFFWFSGRFFQYGTPPEIAVARELEKEITPGTIVISGLGGGYEVGKFLYLMLDHLAAPQNRPNLYVPLSNEGLRNLFAKPELPRAYVATMMPYLWTKLDKQLQETLSVSQWERVSFMIMDTFHNKPFQEEAVALASTSCPHPSIRRVSLTPGHSTWTTASFVVVTCNIAEMRNPIVIR